MQKKRVLGIAGCLQRLLILPLEESVSESVCACLCVCVWEKERARDKSFCPVRIVLRLQGDVVWPLPPTDGYWRNQKKKKKPFQPVSGTVKLKLRIADYCALFHHIWRTSKIRQIRRIKDQRTIEAIKVQFAQETTAYTVVLLFFCATDVLMDVMNKSKLDRFLEQ